MDKREKNFRLFQVYMYLKIKQDFLVFAEMIYFIILFAKMEGCQHFWWPLSQPTQ